jgi:hypothetical protein
VASFFRFLRTKNRTREGPIRTFSLLTDEIKISFHESLPVHQVLARKIKERKALRMANQEIADNLKISRKTVEKALTINT